jgi:hypothetical protein
MNFLFFLFWLDAVESSKHNAARAAQLQLEHQRKMLKYSNPKAYQQMIEDERTEERAERRRALKLLAILTVGCALFCWWAHSKIDEYNRTVAVEPTAQVSSTPAIPADYAPRAELVK